MRTEVQVIHSKYIKIHYAIWKSITVELWSQVKTYENITYSEQELNAWKYLLRESSLLEGRNLHQDQPHLSEEQLEIIKSTIPPQLPHLLVKPVLQEPFLSKSDEQEIKRQCYLLWSGKGSRVRNPNKWLEIAITAMGLKEHYGLTLYDSIQKMPQKLCNVLRFVETMYGEIMTMNENTRNLQESVAREAGLRRNQPK